MIKYKNEVYHIGSCVGDFYIVSFLKHNKGDKGRTQCIANYVCGVTLTQHLKTLILKGNCGCKDRQTYLGKVYRNLEILSLEGVINRYHHTLTKCKVCGNVRVVPLCKLIDNHVACNVCNKPPKSHGMSNTPTYTSWYSMIDRMTNDNNPKTEHYKGRGLSIEPRWLCFTNFLNDMGERPQGTSLDRIDNEKGYWKENCRWADQSTQCVNRSIHGGKYSKYKGAYFDKRDGSWFSSIQFKDFKKYIGRFPDDISAAKAWDKEAKLLGLITNEDLGLFL